MTVRRLYLVRHGETDWNRAGRIQGHTPTALNATGLRQAEILARFFAPRPLGAVWSSDLPRAAQTAEAVAAPHGLAVRILPALRERDLGPIEGMTGDEVDRAKRGQGPDGRDPTSWYEIPGVEQDEAILARVLPVLEEAARTAAEAVLVTHGGVQKAVLYSILGIPATARRGFTVGNGMVAALQPHDGGWRLEGLWSLELIKGLVGEENAN